MLATSLHCFPFFSSDLLRFWKIEEPKASPGTPIYIYIYQSQTRPVWDCHADQRPGVLEVGVVVLWQSQTGRVWDRLGVTRKRRSSSTPPEHAPLQEKASVPVDAVLVLALRRHQAIAGHQDGAREVSELLDVSGVEVYVAVCAGSQGL